MSNDIEPRAPVPGTQPRPGMTPEDFYLKGWERGVRDYAIWKDGAQLVGVTQLPLDQVLNRGPLPGCKHMDLADLGHPGDKEYDFPPPPELEP